MVTYDGDVHVHCHNNDSTTVIDNDTGCSSLLLILKYSSIEHCSNTIEHSRKVAGCIVLL